MALSRTNDKNVTWLKGEKQIKQTSWVFDLECRAASSQYFVSAKVQVILICQAVCQLRQRIPSVGPQVDLVR